MEMMPREAAADDTTTLMVTATVESTVRVSSSKKPSASGSGNSPRQTPPLTTTFTAPSACVNELWQTKEAASISWLHLGPFNSTECMPSGWAPSMYFSPGVCPSGWVMAGQSKTGSGEAVETMATCCPKYLPSGWEFNTLPSKRVPPHWYSSEICQWNPKSKVTLWYTESNKDGYAARSIPFGTNGFINAYGIEVRWRSSDQVSAATATATATETSETSASTDSEAAETSSSGLSPGAKAGVGVGVAVGGLAILFAVAFFLLRRRKQRAKAAGNTGGAAELETSEAGAAAAAQEKKDAESEERPPVELPSNQVSEIDGYKVTPRSPSNDPVELDASSPR